MRASTLLVGLVVFGCGVQSHSRAADASVDAPEGDSDSGTARRDAGPPPVADAGVAPCGRLTASAGVTVFRPPPEIAVDSPQVVYRQDGFDMLARITPAAPTSEVWHRRLYPALGAPDLTPEQIIAPAADHPFFAAQRETALAVCTAEAGRVHLYTYIGPDASPISRRSVWEGRCLGVAGMEDRWLVGAGAGPGSTPEVMVLDAEGAEIIPPAWAIDGGPTDEATIAVGVTGTAFTWASSVRAGTFTVGMTDGRGGYSYTPIRTDGDVSTMTPPAVAPWPFAGGGTAVATFGADGLFVMVVDSGGAEALRSEPLLPAFGSSRPALVSTPFGLVLAVPLFDDVDSARGHLEILVIDHELRPVTATTLEMRRSPTESDEGIALASGGLRALLHYTDHDPSTLQHTTRAVFLDCR